MCINFICQSCHQNTIIYCESVDIYTNLFPKCDLPTYDPHQYDENRKCETCKLINAVHSELISLVYQHPWLETEGMAGLESRQAWEHGANSLRKQCKIDWVRLKLKEEREMARKLERMGLAELMAKEVIGGGEGASTHETQASAHGNNKSASTWGNEGEENLQEEGGDGSTCAHME